MNRVVVQVPMTKQLRDDAEKTLKLQGFSSIQEAIRFLLTQASQGAFSLRVVPQLPEVLNSQDDKKYSRIVSNIQKKNSKMKTYTNTEEIMNYLDS